MSPFVFKNVGTDEQVTLDFTDISRISHDAATNPASIINVHVITVNLARYMFTISFADHLDMLRWLVRNQGLHVVSHLSNPSECRVNAYPEPFAPLSAGEQAPVGDLQKDFCAENIGLPLPPDETKTYSKTSTDLEAVMSHRPLPLGVREALSNIVTHSGSILDALQAMRTKAIADETRERRIGTLGGEEDTEQRGAGLYWDHEIDAFNSIVTDAREAMKGIGR